MTHLPGTGHEGQRIADQGDGTYVNPVFAGDHPDPTVLKDGEDYYLTHSSFESYPGLVIWHSRDLLNWSAVGAALPDPMGSVFASDLCRVGDTYYLYIPMIPTASFGTPGTPAEIYVTRAADPAGPWEPARPMGITGYIDPGHAVGEDGRRYLFLNRGARVRLTEDGLAPDGPIETVYDGWRYPDDWITEAYALEGPKILRKDGWFYMISAVGGTAGPPTGHMVIVARSRSIDGPWEDCPHNPVIRTWDRGDAWWSRGHATFVEGPRGDWWAVYHGYENGFRTLGRQTLLEPIAWTEDGWPTAAGGALDRPLPAPAPRAHPAPHGYPVSDDFESDVLGPQWAFYAPGAGEHDRLRIGAGTLRLTAKGTGPEDSSPLACVVGDRGYDVEVEMELEPGATGGLLLFHDRHLFAGLAIAGDAVVTYRGGGRSHWREPSVTGDRFRLRISNDQHIVTMHYALGDGPWIRHGLRLDTSGYDTNASIELASLRPALMSAGTGTVTFRRFTYRALQGDPT